MGVMTPMNYLRKINGILASMVSDDCCYVQVFIQKFTFRVSSTHKKKNQLPEYITCINLINQYTK